MPKPQVNVPLLRKVYEWVVTQNELPELEREWVQVRWLSTKQDRLYQIWYDEKLEKLGRGSAYPSFQVWKALNQDSYECGTAYCFAGYACLINDMLVKNHDDYRTSTTNGESISRNAIDLLGITDEEGERLFNANNTLEHITCYVSEILERAGERL